MAGGGRKRGRRSIPSPPPSVLVADDDALTRTLIQRILGDAGFLTELFPDGAAALEAYEPGKYGLLVLDNQMPGRTGIELIEEVRGAGDPVPIILISATLTPEVVRRAVHWKAVATIPKPFTPSFFVEVAKELVRGAGPKRSV